MSNNLQRLIDEIGKLDPKDTAHFTKGKQPDSRVLGERLKVAVTAAERNDAWKQFQEQNPGQAKEILAVLETAQVEESAADPEENPAEGEMITGQDALKRLRAKGIKV